MLSSGSTSLSDQIVPVVSASSLAHAAASACVTASPILVDQALSPISSPSRPSFSFSPLKSPVSKRSKTAEDVIYVVEKNKQEVSSSSFAPRHASESAVDELDFFADTYPEYLKMTERDAHFTLLLNSSIEESRTSGKALPFLLARVRTVYYWLTKQNDLALHAIPDQLKSPTTKTALLRFDAEHAVSQCMFEFEAFKWFVEFEDSEKEKINFVRGYSFYADLQDAKTYYFENSPPSLAKLESQACAFEHCVFFSFQFRYGRFPILSMTDPSCKNHIECFLCGECVHILCFYCLFLKLLIEFHLGRSMNWPKFDRLPHLDGIMKFLHHCRKLVG